MHVFKQQAACGGWNVPVPQPVHPHAVGRGRHMKRVEQVACETGSRGLVVNA